MSTKIILIKLLNSLSYNYTVKAYILAVIILFSFSQLNAKEYHVSSYGSDTNLGSKSDPFRTISNAACVAQPGDTITVHEGTYRESINPNRGGNSENSRIIYRAAEGENVVIKGSEVIKGWEKQKEGVWYVSIKNKYFGKKNPYKEIISGDWFIDQGRDHHTGEVYLNEKALFEEVSLDKVNMHALSWCCKVDDKMTHIWANFGESEPKNEIVEINVRATCFYPYTPGCNYITVKGFTMRHAATQWAPPTSEQVAAIGTNWSKGWIIENNIISDSKCVGITLGKYGDQYNNTSENKADGYVKTIERALKMGWSKENVGSHIVRNNTIYNCGAAGICGSLGGIFSEISGNHIYNINIDKPFSGHEMAGIKFHAPIDMLIQNNRIHHTSRGIWLDWMTQGTKVSSNLLYDNGRQDLFVEVNHGPYIVDNNIFLTPYSLKDNSQGGSYVHNLFLGKITTSTESRLTPYHKKHSTEIAGMSDIKGGDNRFYNNIFVGYGLVEYNDARYPCIAHGNVYLDGAKPLAKEQDIAIFPKFDSSISIYDENGSIYLTISLPKSDKQNHVVTTELLGKTKVSGQKYLNPDKTKVYIDTDYSGNKRNVENPTAGPFEKTSDKRMKIKVW